MIVQLVPCTQNMNTVQYISLYKAMVDAKFLNGDLGWSHIEGVQEHTTVPVNRPLVSFC